MRSIKKIEQDIVQTKLDILKRKGISTDWRKGKDIYDPDLVAERDEFSKISHYANELLELEKVRITQLDATKLEDSGELTLLKEHHQLLIELIMNFYNYNKSKV